MPVTEPPLKATSSARDSAARRFGHARVRAHRDVHADVAGGRRERAADHEADRGLDVERDRERDRDHHGDHRDDRVLAVEVGLRAFLDRRGRSPASARCPGIGRAASGWCRGRRGRRHPRIRVPGPRPSRSRIRSRLKTSDVGSCGRRPPGPPRETAQRGSRPRTARKAGGVYRSPPDDRLRAARIGARSSGLGARRDPQSGALRGALPGRCADASGAAGPSPAPPGAAGRASCAYAIWSWESASRTGRICSASRSSSIGSRARTPSIASRACSRSRMSSVSGVSPSRCPPRLMRLTMVWSSTSAHRDASSAPPRAGRASPPRSCARGPRGRALRGHARGRVRGRGLRDSSSCLPARRRRAVPDSA